MISLGCPDRSPKPRHDSSQPRDEELQEVEEETKELRTNKALTLAFFG
jgi:hypothetical protein